METNESSKEQAILDQYKMGEQEAKSVKAWAHVYETDEIMGSYLEKQGYPFSVQSAKKRVYFNESGDDIIKFFRQSKK